MNKILFLLLALLFFSCQKVHTQEQTSASPATKTSLPQAAAPPTAQKIRGNMILSQARAADQIDNAYPYDIELKDAKGKIRPSTELLPVNGRPMVLLFWLTTCGPCRMEMAAIKKEYERWNEEVPFNLVAISTDFQKNFSRFASMVEKQDWPWPAYNDHKREFGQIMPGRLNGLPQTFIIDKAGQIVYHKRKYRPGDEVALFEAVRQAAR